MSQAECCSRTRVAERLLRRSAHEDELGGALHECLRPSLKALSSMEWIHGTRITAGQVHKSSPPDQAAQKQGMAHFTEMLDDLATSMDANCCHVLRKQDCEHDLIRLRFPMYIYVNASGMEACA